MKTHMYLCVWGDMGDGGWHDGAWLMVCWWVVSGGREMVGDGREVVAAMVVTVVVTIVIMAVGG